jgi:hypothetical protein
MHGRHWTDFLAISWRSPARAGVGHATFRPIRRRRNCAAAHALATPSVPFAPRQPTVLLRPRTPALDTCTRPQFGFARIAEWGRVRTRHAAAGISIFNSRTSRIGLFPRPISTSFRLRCTPAGLSFRHELPVRSLRIPAKAMTGMFAYPAGARHDVLCTRISSTNSFPFGNGRVAIQSNSPTAIEVAGQENEQAPRNAAAAAANHIFTVIPIEALNIL